MDWTVCQFSEMVDKQRASGDPWFEFLSAPSLRCGVYVLAKGAIDVQSPHEEDEVYYVESGRSLVRIDGSDYPVQAGSVVYVPARVRHHFHAIEEELRLLVFFSRAKP
jgi:mannose-6-phosphate isomerase-like protein (cupin superfamily)